MRNRQPSLPFSVMDCGGNGLSFRLLIASKIVSTSRRGIALKARLNELLSRHTGQPVERVEQDTDRDNFLSAQEAVEYGLVDEVLTKRA